MNERNRIMLEAIDGAIEYMDDDSHSVEDQAQLVFNLLNAIRKSIMDQDNGEAISAHGVDETR